MLFVALGSFILFLVVVYLIVSPAPRGEPVDEAAEAADLAARKEQLLSDIRELDMDLATGKLAEEDHRRLRAAMVVDAVDTWKALDSALESMERADPIGAASDGPEAVDIVDEVGLEAQILARKQELRARECASCGAAVGAADAFCRRCGAELSTRTTR